MQNFEESRKLLEFIRHSWRKENLLDLSVCQMNDQSIKKAPVYSLFRALRGEQLYYVATNIFTFEFRHTTLKNTYKAHF